MDSPPIPLARAAQPLVAQASKPAVSQVSKPAAAGTLLRARVGRRAADLEGGDTAGLETCATGKVFAPLRRSDERKTRPLLFLLALALALAGCRDHAAQPGEGDAKHKDDGGITFKAREGLAVPEDIARNIGLQLADVTVRKVNGQLTFAAQVYGDAGPQARRVALASAWVDRAAAQFVPVGLDIVAQTVDTNSLTGVVARVLRAADTNAAVEVLLELQAEQGELRPGDFVRVTVSVPGTEALPVVPDSALLRTAEGHFVYVVNGKRLKRAPVKLASGGEGVVAVRDGLLAGDKIVVAGVPLLWLAELQGLRGGKSCADGH